MEVFDGASVRVGACDDNSGSQYTSLAFTEALLDAGMTGSIETVGDALHNAVMESTIGLFKS